MDIFKFFQQFCRAVAQPFGCHPQFQTLIHRQRQKADKDVRLHVMFFLMKNGTVAK